MIKANELRIGSLLEFSNGIQPTKIVTVGRRFFSSASVEKEDGNFEVTPYYKPIPLTEEILLKCGFKHEFNYYESKYLVSLNSEFIIIDRGGFLAYADSPNNELRYLHQLQNLYFALTSEELEVNM